MGEVEMASEKREAVERRLRTRPLRDVARLGRQIYQRDIRRKVEPGHIGAVVSIDVETGRWAMGDELLEAADRLRKQCPEAVNVWSERGGYKTMGRIGGGSLQRTE